MGCLRVVLPCRALPPHRMFLSPCRETHLGFGLGGFKARWIALFGILAKFNLVLVRERKLMM